MNFTTLGALGAWTREAVEAFRRLRDATVPFGSVVHVESGSMKRFGIISRHPDAMPIDRLAVLGESGNVDWIPIDCCEVSDDEADWPWWIKRKKGLIPSPQIGDIKNETPPTV